MTTAEQPVREIIKRPNVGDTLDWAHGPGRVLEVGANGQSVRILDKIDRRWTIAREPGGHWVRTARAPERLTLVPAGETGGPRYPAQPVPERAS